MHCRRRRWKQNQRRNTTCCVSSGGLAVPLCLPCLSCNLANSPNNKKKQKTRHNSSRIFGKTNLSLDTNLALQLVKVI